jgi:hypothetical protein
LAGGSDEKTIGAEVRNAICDLLSEFSARVDEGRGDSVHELFVDESRIETPAFVLQGKARIHERFAARAADKSRKSRHYWSNARFAEKADAIEVTTNVMTAIRLPDGSTMLMGGTSVDLVRQKDGNWLFVSRRLEVVFENTLGSQAKIP